MIRPYELTLDVPVEISNGVLTSTGKVWETLDAASKGDLKRIKELAEECYELIYAQYNYAMPIHFAVREGHLELVKYLLEHGAHNPDYRTYPFLDNLLIIAVDRNYDEIANLLEAYLRDSSKWKFRGDNGNIKFSKSSSAIELEAALSEGDIKKSELILSEHPELISDQTLFWSEGILAVPANHNDLDLVKFLLNAGAKVPEILKWTQAYYFKHFEIAEILMQNGMNPNTMSWQHVTILHDMAQKGNIPKAELLLKFGADINPVNEEYQSTPLGMAARWGHTAMVEFLIRNGADINKAGAEWAMPLSWARKKNHQQIEKMLSAAGGK